MSYTSKVDVLLVSSCMTQKNLHYETSLGMKVKEGLISFFCTHMENMAVLAITHSGSFPIKIYLYFAVVFAKF